MSKIDLLKFIQLKPLTALVTFPPGLGKHAVAEIESIIGDPWIPEKKNTSSAKLLLFPEKILIRNCSFQSIMGICFRSFSLRDIYILLEGIDVAKIKDELPDSLLDWMRECKDFSLQIQIRKNPKLDPQAFLDDCKQSFLDVILDSNSSMSSSNENEIEKENGNDNEGTNIHLTAPRFLISTIRNNSSLYLAVKSKPLYQRGFRTVFPLSAPLSEDLASILIHQLIQKFTFGENVIKIDAFIPFSGTGTFAFELFMQIYKIYPGLLSRKEEEFVNRMNQTKIWKFLFDKSSKRLHNKIQNERPEVQIHNYDFRSDIVENSILNWKNFKNSLKENDVLDLDHLIPDLEGYVRWNMADFFEAEIPKPISQNLIIPLNPPFGIRHKNRESTGSFYKRIAQKINKECLPLTKETKIHGFLLCPDASAYSNATETWQSNWDLETLHLSQGKLSIRALFFSSK